VSDLRYFGGESSESSDLALFPAVVRRPFYPKRKPGRQRLVLVKQPPCPDCGGVVGPVTLMCANCHFRGWWPPGRDAA
jgi:hypothetical protein